MQQHFPLRFLLSTFCIYLAVLCGCGSGKANGIQEPANPPAPVLFSGKVMSGTQPIVGATVQMYATGSTGYGSAATPLLSPATITDAEGNFSVASGTYTCPDANTQIYFIATRGSVNNTVNNAIAMLSAWGNCGELTNSSSPIVSETTTAAAAWALSPFILSSPDIGTSATNQAGLVNALTTARTLADRTTGNIPSSILPSNATIETAKLNSLANTLATCVRTLTASSCSTLFSLATAGTESTPTNTLDAALRIVKNPGRNVQLIYQSASPANQPYAGLTTAPSDWTMSISMTGGGLNLPTAIAINSAGEAWVGNYAGLVSAFSVSGSPLFPPGLSDGGLSQIYGIAIDPSDNIWATNQNKDTVTKIARSGTFLSGTNGYSGGGISHPNSIASDADGNMWITNYTSTVTKLSNNGTPLSSAGYNGGGTIAFPVAVAIANNDTPWVANQVGSVSHLSTTGTLQEYIACCSSPGGIAIDPSGNIWVTDYLTSSVKRLSAGAVSASTVGGGIKYPNGIAVDGTGNIWVANYRGNTLSLIAGAKATSYIGSALSPSGGYGKDAAMDLPFDLAIDASGSILVTSSGNDKVIRFIGLAMPVKTPLIGTPQLP